MNSFIFIFTLTPHLFNSPHPASPLLKRPRNLLVSVNLNTLPTTSQPHYSNPTDPSAPVTMITEANSKITSEHFTDEKQDSRKWLARCLRKPTLRQGKENEVLFQPKLEVSLQTRPQTAPSTGVASPFMSTSMPSSMDPPRPRRQPPPRPPRPDSDVIRDVNAWLDASMNKPAPQLMGGLPYWREGPFTTGCGPSSDVRYAIPIMHTSLSARPTTSHGEQVKTLCRRAKKMQVRMPSLLRAGSQRITVLRRKQPCRRSTSMPLLTISVEDIPSSAYGSIARNGSTMNMTNSSTPATISSEGTEYVERAQFLAQSPRLGSSAGTRFDDQETSMERHVNDVFGQTARRGEAPRPKTASRSAREDSFGNLSDAPTYFTGPPPPSYRSRAASIRTTSSFGCIDGMNRSQQHISQARPVHRSKGVKVTFKRLAQKARINI